MGKKSNGRILHLAVNEKFIDHAYISFENVLPGKNDFWVFNETPINYIKTTPYRSIRFTERLGFKLYRDISRYDIVIVHSLHLFWRSVINSCDRDIVFVWIGWGYDYYNILYPDAKKMLLPATRELTESRPESQPESKNTKRNWKQKISSFLYKVRRLDDNFTLSIKRMSFFSPVLPNEYELVRQSSAIQPFPDASQWNYGSLEEVLLKGFIGRQCTGENILLGNSASATSNHADWLLWLAGQCNQADNTPVLTNEKAQHRAQMPASDILNNRQLICPLSYGDKYYADKIKTLGGQLFAEHFTALTDFMPLTDYLDLVTSCSHLVMNSVRQQGVGIILIMLSLGATVFIRQENPCFDYLRQLGVVLYSVQQLEQQPELLRHRLSADEVAQNQKLLFQIWSKQAIDEKTKNLIKQATERRFNQ